jgi:serine/threonine protein phosphatase PrpC
MAEAALDLQKKYNLITLLEVDNLKVYGVCSSVQNYFISMFEKISPKMIKLMNFKKILIEQNIMFNEFESQIISETTFQFKISTKRNTDLLLIKDTATSYFKKNDITITMKENSIYIHPVKKYKVIYDSATLSLNNCQISGDNLLIKTINESNFLCALSDGMGSGFYAYQLSQETLKMVDNITNCNISFDAALQILNNFFKTKDLSDSYATLDLVNINLTDGILDLYKLGSSTTYISRGNKIIPIYNNNLPFGISDLVTKEEYSIADNDLIILVSDGINDYIDEGLLVKFIETIKDELPHKIVYEILQKIYYENKNQIKDDMSCIAIKIKSN